MVKKERSITLQQCLFYISMLPLQKTLMDKGQKIGGTLTKQENKEPCFPFRTLLLKNSKGNVQFQLLTSFLQPLKGSNQKLLPRNDPK